MPLHRCTASSCRVTCAPPAGAAPAFAAAALRQTGSAIRPKLPSLGLACVLVHELCVMCFVCMLHGMGTTSCLLHRFRVLHAKHGESLRPGHATVRNGRTQSIVFPPIIRRRPPDVPTLAPQRCDAAACNSQQQRDAAVDGCCHHECPQLSRHPFWDSRHLYYTTSHPVRETPAWSAKCIIKYR